MRGIKYIFLAVVLASLCTPLTAEAKLTVPEPAKEAILSVVPGAASLKHLTRPLDCYRLFDSQNLPVGVAVITTRVPPEVSGYQNEIALLVGISEKGVITGVKLLAHEDSPEQIHYILSQGFLKRFLKREPHQKWEDIETVTGATISSGAMRQDIQTAAQAVLDKVIKTGILSRTAAPPAILGFSGISRSVITTGAIFFLITLSLFAVYMPRRRYLRSATLLLSFIAVGILFNFPVTVGNFIDLFYGVIPGLTNLALLILIIFAVFSALLKGPLYCSYLCPFGAAQEITAALKVPKLKIDDAWIRRAAFLRWILLAATISAVVGFGLKGFRNIEPFALCFSPAARLAVWVQAGLILAAALIFWRPWCRLFCPTGLILDLLSRLGTKIRCKVLARCRARSEAP